LVSNLGREFVCFESRDAVDGIHLDKADQPSMLSTYTRDACRACPERGSAGRSQDIAVLRALLARGWNGGN